MIKVTAALSSQSITTLAEPCHTNVVRSHEIAAGSHFAGEITGKNVAMTEIITLISEIGRWAEGSQQPSWMQY